MSSRFTMVIAVVLLFGALLMGYWGLKLSRQPAPEPPPVAAPSPVAQVEEKAVDTLRQPVLVLLRDVPPNVPLSAQDVAVEQLRVAPAGSFQKPEQVIGRPLWRPLGAGTWLTEDSFSAGGPLARMIHPDERALAVAVDEVIGGAGHISPGDYVDVLLYLRQDAGNPEQSAQVVVPALRVLGFGQQLGPTNDGQPALPAVDEKTRQEQSRNGARTAVLAVPEGLIGRLMLATQAGTLRLAVRSAEEQRLQRYWAGEPDAAASVASANRELYQFTQLALARPRPLQLQQTPAAAPARRGVEVIRGNQISQQAQ